MDQQGFLKIANDISEMPVPKYYRLKMDIIGKINTGVWTDHVKLPSESEFCRQYGVSRITVRKTLDELVASKYIYKMQGKGTYVAPQSQREVILARTTYGCEEMIRSQGQIPSHKIRQLGLIPCPNTVAGLLNVQAGRQILFYERTYYGNNDPAIHAKSYLDHQHLPGIETLDLASASLSKLITEDYNLTVTSNRCVLKAITAGLELGEALGVDTGFPLLSRDVVTVASNGVETFPLEVCQLYYRTDSVPYIAEN